jgi:hypothetical protein
MEEMTEAFIVSRLGFLRFNQLLEASKGLFQKLVILTGAAKLDGHLTEEV